MADLQIVDVPSETMAVLSRRAQTAQQSLEEYVRDRLIDEARRTTLGEVLDQLGPVGLDRPGVVHNLNDPRLM